MIKNTTSIDQKSFDKLSRLYIVALSTIALSVIISQFLVHKHLNTQLSDSRVINIAGRQRMLSQKLAKEIVKLTVSDSQKDRSHLKNRINETLYIWELSHRSLQMGNDSLGIPKANSAKITTQFKELNPVFDTIKRASDVIVKSLNKNLYTSSDNLSAVIEKISKYENVFLTLMDGIVNQYEIEANRKVQWLRKLEISLMIITLVILLFEFLFIFWPTAKTVKKTFQGLLDAERKAKKMAVDADKLSILKEQSIKELRALTYAMDETLLFARTSTNGTIIHLGKRFSRLFAVSKFGGNPFLWNLLSSKENEQTEFEDLFKKYKNIGWQGEVKATNRKNEDIWLEMSIIPFRPTEEKSELLIIASNITDRKAAQLEIEILSKKSFEEKMIQQKIISSKIIENQEKEQNRIAKDVHDGIGQMLTGLKYNLESINTTNIEKTTEKIEHLKELTANIIKGVRTATFNLTPPELTDHGIVPAISKLAHELGKLTGKNILVFNKTSFNGRLDSLVEINIYRIAQEAINNAIKYSGSLDILVTVSHSKNMLSILVDDNGNGFEIKKIKNVKNAEGGMGLTFMRERIKYIGGRLFLNSELGKGTRITLNIPI